MEQKEVDLGSATVGPSLSTVKTVPYDPAEDREGIRGTIAISLIGLLAGTIVVAFVLLWRHPDRSKELHELLELVFGPLVALVGSAVGYYFGSQAGSKS